MRESNKLLKLIPKLDSMEFIGLAHLLRVQLVEEVNPSAAVPAERYAARGFNEVLADIIRKFEDAPRARRREIIQILTAATQKGGNSDADNSKDT